MFKKEYSNMVLYTLQMKEHHQISHESISIHSGLKIPHNFRGLTKTHCKFPQDNIRLCYIALTAQQQYTSFNLGTMWKTVNLKIKINLAMLHSKNVLMSFSDTSSISISSNTPPYDSVKPNNEQSKPSWMPGQSSESSITHSIHSPSEKALPSLPTSTYPTMDKVPNSRPSSYGRGIAWTPSTNIQISNSDFGSDTWHVTSSGAVSIPQNPTEPWYPAISNYGSNAVDEPNQQGLSNNNLATRMLVISDVVLITATMVMFVLM